MVDNSTPVNEEIMKSFSDKHPKNYDNTSPTMTIQSEFIAKEKAQIIEKQNKKLSMMTTIVMFVFALIFVGVFGFLCYLVNSGCGELKEGKELTMKFQGIFAGFVAAGVFAIVLFSFSVVEIILIIMSSFKSLSAKGKFVILALMTERVYISICFGGLIFPFALNMIKPFNEMVLALIKEDAPKYSFPKTYPYLLDKFLRNYESISMKVFYIGLIFLLKNLALLGLNYSVKNKTFFKKQALNNIKIDVLKDLNRSVQAAPNDSIEEVVQKIIVKYSRGDGLVHYTEAAEILGDEKAERLFAFADPNGDLNTTKDELISFYKKTFAERENIEIALNQSNVSIGALDNGLTFICVLLAVFIAWSSQETDIKTSAITFGTTLITGSYIFSDLIKKFLTAIAFVFFVRGFEVGDKVFFNNDYYEVYEINLLATIFLKSSLKTVAPNDKLYETTLSNLSTSESMDVEYTFKFDTADFKEKSKEFLREIVKYYRKHRSTFDYKPYFSKVELCNTEQMKVNLVTGYTLKYYELDVIEKRKNSFLLFVHDALVKSGLKAL